MCMYFHGSGEKPVKKEKEVSGLLSSASEELRAIRGLVCCKLLMHCYISKDQPCLILKLTTTKLKDDTVSPKIGSSL